MSIHLRRWGLAAAMIVAFTTPHFVTRAQSGPILASPSSGSSVQMATQSLRTTPLLAEASTTTIPASGIKEVLHLKITAYTSLPNETDNTPFITANGTYVHSGIVATNLLPFGTKVMIPALFGDRVFTVEDRMNRKFDHNMDIWMPTYSQAITFGAHKHMDVIVLSSNATPAAAAQNTIALANTAMAMAADSISQGPFVRQL